MSQTIQPPTQTISYFQSVVNFQNECILELSKSFSRVSLLSIHDSGDKVDGTAQKVGKLFAFFLVGIPLCILHFINTVFKDTRDWCMQSTADVDAKKEAAMFAAKNAPAAAASTPPVVLAQAEASKVSSPATSASSSSTASFDIVSEEDSPARTALTDDSKEEIEQNHPYKSLIGASSTRGVSSPTGASREANLPPPSTSPSSISRKFLEVVGLSKPVSASVGVSPPKDLKASTPLLPLEENTFSASSSSIEPLNPKLSAEPLSSLLEKNDDGTFKIPMVELLTTPNVDSTIAPPAPIPIRTLTSGAKESDATLAAKFASLSTKAVASPK